MPRADGSIVIDTKLDTTQLQKSLKNLGPKLAAAGKIAGGALATGFGIAVAAIGAYTIAAINGAEEDAAFSRQLKQTTKSMGIFGDQADEVADRLDELAGKNQYLIGVDENVIKATQAKLLTFKELAKTADTAGGAFDRATQAAIDMAAKGFGDSTSNAVQLGKALNDPIKGITALNRAGINFTKSEREKIKTLVESNRTLEAQDYILQAIEKQVGGSAKAAMKASDQIKIAFGEIGDSLGTALLPLIEVLAPAISDFLIGLQPLMGDLGTAIASFIQGVGSEKNIQAAATALGTYISDGLKRATPIITDGFNALFTTMAQIVPTMTESIGLLASSLIGTMAAALPSYIEAVINGMLSLIGALVDSSDQWLTPMADAAVAIIDLLITELTKPDNIKILVDAGLALGGAVASGILKAMQNNPILKSSLAIAQFSTTGNPMYLKDIDVAGILSGAAASAQSELSGGTSVTVNNTFNTPSVSFAETIAASKYGNRRLVTN